MPANFKYHKINIKSEKLTNFVQQVQVIKNACPATVCSTDQVINQVFENLRHKICRKSWFFDDLAPKFQKF